MKKQKNTGLKHQNMLIAGAVAAATAGAIFWYTVKSEPDVPVVDMPTILNSANNTGSNTNKPANTPPAGDPNQLKGKNILNIGPQNPGNSLIVDLVNLVKPGFVVIHQANSKGQAGTFVAASPLLKAGTSEDLVVKASLRANTTYVISLRNDDGDGKFNPTKDLVLSDVKGQQVVENITTATK